MVTSPPMIHLKSLGKLDIGLIHKLFFYTVYINMYHLGPKTQTNFKIVTVRQLIEYDFF